MIEASAVWDGKLIDSVDVEGKNGNKSVGSAANNNPNPDDDALEQVWTLPGLSPGQAFSILKVIGIIGKQVGRNAIKNAAKGLPKKVEDLLKRGYKETSHPGAAKAGHRTFENSKTGDKVRFDQGKPGKPGYEGQDHYHRYNPNATSKADQYLDKNGNPCARGCDASHLFPEN